MLNYVVLGLIGAVVVLGVYVRLAPVNAPYWHGITLPQGAPGEAVAAGSYTVLRAVEQPIEALTQLDQIITETPRTTRIAGSIEDGKITYMTRSRVFGFPDFTTVVIYPEAAASVQATLAVFGRLRFGKADLGVNRARIMGWMDALDGETAE